MVLMPPRRSVYNIAATSENKSASFFWCMCYIGNVSLSPSIKPFDDPLASLHLAQQTSIQSWGEKMVQSQSSMGMLALAAMGLITGTSGHLETCPSRTAFSCSSSSTQPTCCFNYPGGTLLQTQFWDTNPSSGPDDSWTIHGLWYVKTDIQPGLQDNHPLVDTRSHRP